MLQSGQLNIYSFRNTHTRDVQLVRLFEGEELHAYLLVVPPGAEISRHAHENKHEIFDVLEGEGALEVDGRRIDGTPGRCIFVPAGTAHSLRNTSSAPWTPYPTGWRSSATTANSPTGPSTKRPTAWPIT